MGKSVITCKTETTSRLLVDFLSTICDSSKAMFFGMLHLASSRVSLILGPLKWTKGLRFLFMEIKLKNNPKEIINKFYQLQTKSDVADILEVEVKFIDKILFGIRERTKYKNFEIKKKSSKKRLISSPPKNISILQSKLHAILSLVYSPKICVHGFVKKKNIYSNASKHTSKKHVVNIDLENFFPSIHLGRVRGALKSRPFLIGHDAAEIIAQICCTDDGVLPQGGATSPIISNIICRSIDNELMKYASNNRCQYTRYADDITFSTTSYRLPKGIASVNDGKLTLASELLNVIEKQDFKINYKKTRYSSPNFRQEVTGLTVNEHPNIPRYYIKSIMGALYAWEKFGYELANKKYLRKYQPLHFSGLNLNNVLWGKICYIKMILGDNSPLFRKLAKKYNKLSTDNKFNIKSIIEIEPYPLRGKHPSNQVWNKWFNKYKDSIIFIETENNGQKGTATGFYIGNNLFATAKHNLKYKNSKMYIGDFDFPTNTHIPYDEKSIDVAIIENETPLNSRLAYLPTQMRLPEIGEEVAAIGYPVLSQRNPSIVMHIGVVEALRTLVMHVGVVEALPETQDLTRRFIQVSFQSGGGLSGGCLIDKGGFVIGIMVENIYNMGNANVPDRPYGQSVPVEYLYDKVFEFNKTQ